MFQCRSYNRRMNVWYVYEVDYVWDEAKQKKVQRRKCVGKIDPETDQVIPNGKRGPARVTPGDSSPSAAGSLPEPESRVKRAASSLLTGRKFKAKAQKLSRTLKDLSEQLAVIAQDLDELLKCDDEDEDASSEEMPLSEEEPS
ncbi:hypothetical protein [Succinimonas sp.]|uniref:hypothetical protein n=1 Tax=Succinimonas sp. TaxID=1936151 RepID=UPI00386F05FA